MGMASPTFGDTTTRTIIYPLIYADFNDASVVPFDRNRPSWHERMKDLAAAHAQWRHARIADREFQRTQRLGLVAPAREHVRFRLSPAKLARLHRFAHRPARTAPARVRRWRRWVGSGPRPKRRLRG